MIYSKKLLCKSNWKLQKILKTFCEFRSSFWGKELVRKWKRRSNYRKVSSKDRRKRKNNKAIILASSSKNLLHRAIYRVCHGFRRTKQDDYFLSHPFEASSIFWGSSEIMLEPKTKLQYGNPTNMVICLC